MISESGAPMHDQPPIRQRLLWRRLLAAWIVVVFLLRQIGSSQETDDKRLADRWFAAYRKIAESIEMHRGDAILKLEDKPLLFYTNPIRMNDQHGTIFLWTERGRPAVFGSIWSERNRMNPAVRNVTHEFHSLAQTADAEAARSGNVLWSAEEAGIEWQTIENCPAPATSRPARLAQMRDMGRRLSASVRAGDGDSDLRLMTQPLFRYPEQVEEAIDGGLFTFALATDPEIVVWMEAIEHSGREQWRFAFARFGHFPMRVKDGERTIWSCAYVQPPLKRGKYCCVWRAEQMPADPTNKQ